MDWRCFETEWGTPGRFSSARSLRVQILSFRHTKFSKHNRLGSQRLPPTRSAPPYGKSWIRHRYSYANIYTSTWASLSFSPFVLHFPQKQIVQKIKTKLFFGKLPAKDMKDSTIWPVVAIDSIAYKWNGVYIREGTLSVTWIVSGVTQRSGDNDQCTLTGVNTGTNHNV